ncbi:protein kinase domain-containing protein [Chiayiivirga flava]|uniref:Non-specific serine/threonine protein kinase n=1 Tax=Chiayiivirga flava TaxID=659595 RepID=A0A7W8D228_9GAMM|nr:winged helix-turn-helix domain-containing protein [Chiayiivirga flava]MBB5206486.1 non-specific serine/threonine protein kinase [Chiayiivirga flava]
MERSAFSYRFGTAEFDESRFELRVAGLPVEVERRALEVLAYLLRHAGEVVTKDELLREVWAGRVTVDKVLPNAVNKLRRALGEANAGHITTQARLGYRLDGPVTRTAVGRQPASELELAAGHPVVGRENFILQRQLGRTAGSEVWLAVHGKTRERRVYKFGLDHHRLRALKREATLLRVLQESVADRSHFIEIIDWNFENPPFFLECQYGGRSLADWAPQHLHALDEAARIALFLQIADAVAAAHSVGVLHKDLKPANVLIDDDVVPPRVRLTDFGSGGLLDPERLERLGITRLGMTVEQHLASDSSSGTPLYVAPELFDGQAPTVQSDVFALGILLYQLLSGRMAQPMASGWEQNIADPLLQDDLRRATDGDPARRLASAADLAARLRRLDTRRTNARERARRDDEARRLSASLARTQARRPILAALVATLALGVVVAVVLQQAAVRARNEARAELERATAITRFVNDDLIGRSNPLVSARGADATLRDVLLAARARVAARFGNQPASEAAVRASLAGLFNALDLWPEAEAEAQRALDLYESLQGVASPDALRARSNYVRILSRLGRNDDADAQLRQLQALLPDASGASARYLVESARSTLLIARGDFAGAVPALQTAIAALRELEPDNTALHDALRLDLIACLALAQQPDQARIEADALIAQARARDEDSALVVALAQLALARAMGEDHDGAEALLLQAQPVIVERLGENHSRHLQLLGELLGVAFRRSDWASAAVYAQRVHERVRAKFGDAHPMTWVTLGNWGRTLNEAGDARAALQPLREAVARLRDVAGGDAPQTHDASFVLAQVELELGHVDAAATLIDGLDPAILEAGRPHGLWPSAIDALRGLLALQRGDTTSAHALLDRACNALASEEDLSAPSRLYARASAALDTLR